jgi:hypothetical protein
VSQAKELEGEVMFRTTVMNKQVESINKVRHPLWVWGQQNVTLWDCLRA